MSDLNQLSVFFPFHNEEKNIAPVIEKADAVLKNLQLKDYEIICINDGSIDKTAQVLEQMKNKYPNIKIITHEVNRGYGGALRSGFYNAKYPWIVFTDADGQFDFSEVTKLLDKADGVDLVVGYRLNRNDSLIRKLNGFAWTTLNNLLFGLGVRDVDCAFKLLKKEVIDTIPKLESSRGGMISPELLAKARRQGFKIVEVGVHHYPRLEGKSTGANLKVIFKSFADLFKLWWKLR